MASNHGNLEKHRYLPWFKGRYGVHAGVNGKGGGGRGERVLERIRERRERAGRDGARKVMENRGGGRERGGGGRGAAVKTGDTSVGNVYSYRTANEWEGAD